VKPLGARKMHEFDFWPKATRTREKLRQAKCLAERGQRNACPFGVIGCTCDDGPDDDDAPWPSTGPMVRLAPMKYRLGEAVSL
jgi:hypothetical protein